MSAFVDVPSPPVPAFQNIVEIEALWEHVAARPHAKVLEIGSLYGGTLWWWSHLPAIKLLVAVDLPSDRPEFAADVRAARNCWAAWMSGRVDFVDMRGDSRDPYIVETVGALGPFDFVFIDGDHSYDGVRGDWMTWCSYVSSGGIVAFHDTWPNEARHEPGVVRWVDEFRHHLPSIEWTAPDGVGICAFQLP